MKIIKFFAFITSIAIIIFILINYQKGQRLEKYNKEAADYFKKEEYQSAIDSYQKIINEDPRISGAYIGIAATYGIQHDYSNSKKYCLKALNVDPRLEGTNVFQFCEKIISTK